MKQRLPFLCFLLLLAGWLNAQSVQDARKLLYYERYDSAVNLLHSLVDRDPGNAEAWYLLTAASLHTCKTAEIRSRLSAMPASLLNTPLVLCAYGQLYLQDNKVDSARYNFGKALEQTKEKDPVILLAIARAQLDAKAGDPNYSIELINKALKRDKHNPELYTVLGNTYRKLSNGTESYKAYQAALAQDSKYAEALYQMGTIFSAQDNAEMYLKYFSDAVAMDPQYAPAWYELYYHYYFKDVKKAKDCLDHYIAVSDRNSRNDYLLTDLLYVSKEYTTAIEKAKALLAAQGERIEPRMYKLLAYCYKELNDTSNALHFMRTYFDRQNDTGFVVKDYETMAEIYQASGNRADSVAHYYTLAVGMEKDSLKRIDYYKKLGELYKKIKDYPAQAYWLGKYYQDNHRATNLDLFNWGLAHYMARDYKMADSVFGLYTQKYPEQPFGYFWRARSNAAIDTSMQYGLAVPHYLKLVELDSADTTSKINRKQLIESYGYIAAYKANTEKDYASAITYFEKLLSLDPGNNDAKKYVEILKKNQARNQQRNETSKAGGGGQHSSGSLQ